MTAKEIIEEGIFDMELSSEMYGGYKHTWGSDKGMTQICHSTQSNFEIWLNKVFLRRIFISPTNPPIITNKPITWTSLSDIDLTKIPYGGLCRLKKDVNSELKSRATVNLSKLQLLIRNQTK